MHNTATRGTTRAVARRFDAQTIQCATAFYTRPRVMKTIPRPTDIQSVVSLQLKIKKFFSAILFNRKKILICQIFPDKITLMGIVFLSLRMRTFLGQKVNRAICYLLYCPCRVIRELEILLNMHRCVTCVSKTNKRR